MLSIATIVKTAISAHNNTKLNGFKKTLRYSKLVEDINNAHNSIVSADVYTVPYKKLFITPGVAYSNIIDFGFPLSIVYTISYDEFVETTIKAVYSMTFQYRGRLCNLQDDLNGSLGVYTADGEDKNTLLITVGTVDYSI